MGEVYRATDSKLGREVAIKLIPEDFANDATRMARFTRWRISGILSRLSRSGAAPSMARLPASVAVSSFRGFPAIAASTAASRSGRAATAPTATRAAHRRQRRRHLLDAGRLRGVVERVRPARHDRNRCS